jgi:hypothetical protein
MKKIIALFFATGLLTSCSSGNNSFLPEEEQGYYMSVDDLDLANSLSSSNAEQVCQNFEFAGDYSINALEVTGNGRVIFAASDRGGVKSFGSDFTYARIYDDYSVEFSPLTDSLESELMFKSGSVSFRTTADENMIMIFRAFAGDGREFTSSFEQVTVRQLEFYYDALDLFCK